MSVRIVTNKIVILSPGHAPIKIGSPDQLKFSEARVRNRILRLLQENTLCSLATVRRNNHAHISPVYFCYSEDLELYFLSDPRSLHCQNLLTNASMAVTIFDSSQKWGLADRGMQFFGMCSAVRQKENTQHKRNYCMGNDFKHLHNGKQHTVKTSHFDTISTALCRARSKYWTRASLVGVSL